MRRIIYGTIYLFVALTLVSCASGIQFAKLQPGIKPTTAERGRIFFYRPSSFGAALRPDVYLNGKKVGEAISLGFFMLIGRRAIMKW